MSLLGPQSRCSYQEYSVRVEVKLVPDVLKGAVSGSVEDVDADLALNNKKEELVKMEVVWWFSWLPQF